MRSIGRRADQAPTTSEAQIMSEADSTPSYPPFPRTQRELVGLALQRGARRPNGPAAPGSQRERVRLALQLGVGGAAKRGGPGDGTYR
jgi:hypothetical protein